MQFRGFLENFATEIVKIQPLVKEMTICEDIAPGIRVYRALTKFPWPLTDRVMVNIEYLRIDQQANELLWMAAGTGNEEFVSRFIDANYSKYVLASTTISGYLIRPEIND